MSDEPTLLGTLITWFPMLLLIAVWLIMMWRMGIFRRNPMNQAQYMQEILHETKRQNAALEAIITRMDARLSQLETAHAAAKRQDVQGAHT